jgi:AsmA protein
LYRRSLVLGKILKLSGTPARNARTGAMKLLYRCTMLAQSPRFVSSFAGIDTPLMSSSRRTLFFALIACAAMLTLVAAGVLFLMGAKSYQGRLEATASQALGMEFKVGGPLHVGFFSDFMLTLDDVHVRNRGIDIASAKQAKLGIELLPMLAGSIRVTGVALSHSRISIERDRDGRLNVASSDPAAGVAPALDWPNLTLSDATIVYADQRSGRTTEAADCRIDVRGAHLLRDANAGLMKDASFTADVACAEIRNGASKVSDVKFAVDARHSVLELKPISTRAFDAQGSGRMRLDFTGAVPRYEIECSFPQLSIAAFSKALALRQTATGRADQSATLSMQGRSEKELRQTMAGRISLRGRNITLSGSDLDQVLVKFEPSQTLNLLDVGAGLRCRATRPGAHEGETSPASIGSRGAAPTYARSSPTGSWSAVWRARRT